MAAASTRYILFFMPPITIFFVLCCSACLARRFVPGCETITGILPPSIPAGTGRKNDVVLTSMRRDYVASTSIRRHLVPNDHWDVFTCICIVLLIRWAPSPTFSWHKPPPSPPLIPLLPSQGRIYADSLAPML